MSSIVEINIIEQRGRLVQDVLKIKQAIKDNRKDVPENMYDRALYATYLYCVRSHYRGRLHMKTWNKRHEHAYNFGRHGHPRSGRLEFNTLDDQQRFIDHIKAYIVYRQSAPHYSDDWKKLTVDFDMLTPTIQSLSNIVG